MFSYMGRTIFTLFAVAMVFSKGGSKSYPIMNVIVGIVGVCLCIFNFFVVCKHPDFQKGGALYDDGEAQSGPAPAPSKKATPAKPAVGSYSVMYGLFIYRLPMRLILSKTQMMTFPLPLSLDLNLLPSPPRSLLRSLLRNMRKTPSRMTILLMTNWPMNLLCILFSLKERKKM